MDAGTTMRSDKPPAQATRTRRTRSNNASIAARAPTDVTWSNATHTRRDSLTTPSHPPLRRRPFSVAFLPRAPPPPMLTPANDLSWRSAWPRAAAAAASAALAASVFAFLDVVDVLLCLVYAVLDCFLEDSPVGCYCHHRTHAGAAAGTTEDEGVSDTLYVRRSACRDALWGLLGMVLTTTTSRRRCTLSPEMARSPRWSDCGCASCRAWRRNGGDDDAGRLHYVVKQPPAAPKDAAAIHSREGDRHADDGTIPEPEDAIFIHGFTSSSYFWAETVFPESATLQNCRLLAVDLLGFGDSPKPANCMYTLRDHVEAIERSVVEPLDLRSFHLVSHSMGCIIALALAAKHPGRVKSITLVAPPYFLPCEEKASQVALSRLAEKKLWPPLLFGSAVMSWYEHIGRTVCFLVCKNHLLWEWLYKLLTRKSAVDFVVRDLTRHTHHSAWHTMHNVICGGARLQDGNLEAVAAAGVPVKVIHGVADQVVPVECSHHLKSKLPTAELRLLDGCDHRTVVMGREKEFAEELREFWSSQAACQKPRLHQGVQQVNGC